jgi:hypothetical protein
MKYAIAALLLSLAAGAGANDGIGAVSAGGIVFRKTDAIAMKKEVLNVGHEWITVDYEFLNESDGDVEETVIFPMPAYPVGEQGADTYFGQPGGFKVTVDGKDVPYRAVVRALLDGTDVTAELKKAGLSETQIVYADAFAGRYKIKVPPLGAQQRKQLKAAGLIGDGVGGPESRLWEAQVSYVWQQKFPRNRIVRIHHEYRPLVGAGPGESLMTQDTAKHYCADRAFLNSWDKAGRERVNSAAKVSYILKTGNTWKNGIEDFTLNLVKSDPTELVTLCFPGTFKKIDTRTYQVKLRNFQPTQDLEVFFGNPAYGSDSSGAEMPRLSR